jgi:hypothetical protein
MLYPAGFKSAMNCVFIESWLWSCTPVGFRLFHFLSFTAALRYRFTYCNRDSISPNGLSQCFADSSPLST